MLTQSIKRYKYSISRVLLLLGLIFSTLFYFTVSSSPLVAEVLEPEVKIIKMTPAQKEISQEGKKVRFYKQFIQSIQPSISDGESTVLVKAVLKYSNEFKIDPNVAIGLIRVESSFDKYAISPVGALGYMQILPKWHLDKIKILRERFGHGNVFDVDFNIALGLMILNEYKSKYKSIEKGLLKYNGSLHFEKHAQVYDKDVLRTAKSLKKKEKTYYASL